MKIQEFAKKYCDDILTRAAHSDELFNLDGFSYDTIITDEETGAKVKVICTTNYQIPLVDILSLGREDFARFWPQEECLAAFDQYLSNYILLEGAEALQLIQAEIRKAQAALDAFAATEVDI